MSADILKFPRKLRLVVTDRKQVEEQVDFLLQCYEKAKGGKA